MADCVACSKYGDSRVFFPLQDLPSVLCELWVSRCPSHGEQYPLYHIVVWELACLALVARLSHAYIRVLG